MTDSASGNAAPAAVTTQGVTLTGDNSLLFSGNDSHVTAVLATDEIFAADKEWTIDFWMKPIANSSEWNYILTENTGDWGSHSIGLTWNKSKSVLEQDTGGYVASVIKAPNWPNNSIACAVGEWHFVAVEKQKTTSGWSLNYYLNGAIWLQVAFTADFVPFDASDNPFWFGGKTTDSGRWFKGEVNKLRVTMGARYGGKAFAVPDRLTDYAAPAGQPVWTEGIDRSRLLPENPNNGDIPCYSNEPPVGVNYNDANTVLLLQGSSDNTAAAPTSERLNGIVTGEFPVQEDGSILVNGTSNYITFNDVDTRRVFSGEFTLETYIKTTQFTASGKRQDTNWCVVYRNGGSVTDYQWLLLSDFYADAGKFGIWPYPQMSGETFPKTLINAEFQHVAIDVYMVDGVRKFTMYRNGVPYHTGNYWSTTPADWSSGVSAAMRLFGEGPSGGDDYLSNASVMSLRVSNIARYKGVSFDPPADGKYLNPPAGYWGKLNKSELAMKSDFPSGNIVTNVSGATADSTGYVSLKNTDEYDFSAIKNNTVPWAAPASVLTPIGNRRVQRFYSENTAVLLLSDNSFFPLIAEELGDGRYVTLKPIDASKPMWFGICTDGFKMEISQFTVGLYGDTDCSFEYELYGSPYERLNYSSLDASWNLVHSGEIYLINNGDFETATTDIPVDSRGYYRSYAFVMKNVSGPGIISWLPSYIANNWGRLSPVLSVNGHYASANSNEIQLPEATTSAAGLMSATDREKSIGLTTRGIYPNALAKAGAVDFNELIDHGFYFIGGGADHINYPGTDAKLPGTLIVLRRNNYLTQTFSAVGAVGTSVWERNMYRTDIGNAFTATNWHRLISDADITESKARPGYFKLPGGTIVQWGKKTAITRDEENCYISFPIAFPTMFLAATAIASSGTLSATGVIVSLSEASTTSMTMVVKNHPNTGSPDMDQYIEMYWFAVGF